MAESIVISCRLCPGCWKVIPEGRCNECRRVYAAKYRESARASEGSVPKKRYETKERIPKTEITAEVVRRLFEYDPTTGDFRRAGGKSVLGYLNHGGYLMIWVLGWPIRAHRLAWLYVYGQWPGAILDHINGSRIDNRIENLREATDAVNSQNLRAPKSHNRSGHLGVVRRPKSKKWIARITTDGKLTELGSFDTPEAAAAAYLNAKRLMHEGCTV